MLIVYEHGESVCCQKVRIVLEEKSLDFEQRYVKIEKGETKAPEFLAVNPRGVVPVVVHNGRTITESTIISEYLDDAFPSPPLMPEDPYFRARRRYWARRIDDEMHVPHIATISCIIAFNKAFRAELVDTQEKLEAYLAKIPIEAHRRAMQRILREDFDTVALKESLIAYDQFLGEMETELSDNNWLAGDSFSLADIDVIPYIWRLKNLQLDFMWANRPRVADWFERVTSRPSFKISIIDAALPEWMELMAASGKEAQPIAMRLLNAQG